MFSGLSPVLFLIIVAAAIAIPLVLISRSDKNKKKRQEEQKASERQREISNYELLLARSGFKLSKALHFEKHHFAIDTNANMLNITSNQTSRSFAYKDLVSFEMIEDGQLLTSSGTDKAVAGGLLFGVAGAVVGSTMKKTTNICSNMQLRIAVNDVLSPSIVVNLISPPGAVKNGIMYTEAFNFAKEVCSTLAVIQKQSA